MTSYRLILAVAILGVVCVCNAQDCRLDADGSCGPSNKLLATLTGSNQSIDVYLSENIAKSTGCNNYTTEASCNADTVNVCAWNSSGTPSCDSNAMTAGMLACNSLVATDGTAACDVFFGIKTYCDNLTDSTLCAAKEGCSYDTNSSTCAVNDAMSNMVTRNVLTSLNSTYAAKIMNYTVSCAAYNATTCATAKIVTASTSNTTTTTPPAASPSPNTNTSSTSTGTRSSADSIRTGSSLIAMIVFSCAVLVLSL